MRAAWVIAGKDLRQRLRDRSAFIVGFLAPFALAYIFSLLLGPVSDEAFLPALGLVDADGGEAAAGLVELLEAMDREGQIELTSGLGEEEALQAVEEGELAAVILVPEGFTRVVVNLQPAVVEVVGNVDAPTSTEVAQAIAQGFVGRLQCATLAVATLTAAEGGLQGDPASLAAEAAAAPDPVEIGLAETAAKQLDPTTFYVAGMAIFFVFFTVQYGVTSLLDERREGTMARLLAAPISRGALLAGKAATSVVLGVVSMAVLTVSSRFLMGANWGDPAGAGLLILAAVISATGVTALVAGLSSTPEGAGNSQSIIAVVLGILGGAFFPVSLGEGVIDNLSLLTPHQWFLRGLAELAGGGGPGDVLVHVAAMTAFGLAAGLLGWPGLRRKVEP